MSPFSPIFVHPLAYMAIASEPAPPVKKEKRKKTLFKKLLNKVQAFFTVSSEDVFPPSAPSCAAIESVEVSPVFPVFSAKLVAPKAAPFFPAMPAYLIARTSSFRIPKPSSICPFVAQRVLWIESIRARETFILRKKNLQPLVRKTVRKLEEDRVLKEVGEWIEWVAPIQCQERGWEAVTKRRDTSPLTGLYEWRRSAHTWKAVC